MMGIVLLGISKWNNNSKHRYGKDTEKQGKFGEYLCGLCLVVSQSQFRLQFILLAF